VGVKLSALLVAAALGQGSAVQGGVIARALKLVRANVGLWLVLIVVASLLAWGVGHV